MSATKSLFLILSGLLLNCQDVSENKISENKVSEKQRYLVSATPREETELSTLQLLAEGLGQASLGAWLKYDVASYTIHYTTTFKGKPVTASGLVTVPVNMTSDASLVSLQHGTTFEKDEAPSVRGGFQGQEFLAAAGYVTLMPDFLGYGASSSIFHPYYDRKHAALTVIDFVHAVREFLSEQGVSFTEKLFLAGYSEGGYVTLAAAKEIETNASHGLDVTAVAAGAGGYDLRAMLNSITSETYYAYPAYLAFVLMAYNQVYEWNKPLSYFFSEQYAQALSRYMDGNHSGGFINSKLTTHIPSLLHTDFYERLRSPDGEEELRSVLGANSIVGWKTSTPIRLYHGENDEIIPYENSAITLESFKGSGSDHVTLTKFPGGKHGNSFQPMLIDFIPWFLSL